MKPTLIGVFFLSFMCLGSETPTEVLIAESKKEIAACEQHAKKLGAIGGKLKGVDDDKGGYYFVDGVRTLRVAEELKKYPGGSPAAYEVTSRVIIRLENDPAAATTLFQLPGCPVVKYYKVGKALLNGIARYRIEPTPIRDALLSYVRKNVDKPMSLVDLMIRVSLLEKMLEAKLVSSPDILALRSKTESFKKEIQRSGGSVVWEKVGDVKKFRSLSEKERKNVAAVLLKELKGTETLSKELGRVVSGL